MPVCRPKRYPRSSPLAPPDDARLFDAQQAGAPDLQLQQIAAEGLKEIYFQDSGCRAGSLEEVRFTDIEHIKFDLCAGLPTDPTEL